MTQPSTVRQDVMRLLGNSRKSESFDLLAGQELSAYVDRLFEQAELLLHLRNGALEGFIAFYCNDRAALTSFITMVVVEPESRGRGVGAGLVSSVLSITAKRSFNRCILKVHKLNATATRLYEQLGFRFVETDGEFIRMETEV